MRDYRMTAGVGLGLLMREKVRQYVLLQSRFRETSHTHLRDALTSGWVTFARRLAEVRVRGLPGLRFFTSARSFSSIRYTPPIIFAGNRSFLISS